jgi:predicted metalloprotease with PDZ domain
VETGSPAHQAGIDPGDELLAINGFRLSADQLSDRLKDFQPGQTVEITHFHQDELRNSTVTLAKPRPTRYQVVVVDDPSPAQEQNFASWLGVSLKAIA